MEEYLRKYFGLSTAFDYLKESHRIFHRGLQLL